MRVGVDWKKALARFVADQDSITHHEAHPWVTLRDLKVGMSVSGGGHLFLGFAVTAWASGVLTMRCPSCQGRAYVITAGGSDLSGHGQWRGWCPQCGIVAKDESITKMVRSPMLQGNWGVLGCQPVLGIVVPGWHEFMDAEYPDCLVDDGLVGGDR